jgi:hypothetical protein
MKQNLLQRLGTFNRFAGAGLASILLGFSSCDNDENNNPPEESNNSSQPSNTNNSTTPTVPVTLSEDLESVFVSYDEDAYGSPQGITAWRPNRDGRATLHMGGSNRLNLRHKLDSNSRYSARVVYANYGAGDRIILYHNDVSQGAFSTEDTRSWDKFTSSERFTIETSDDSDNTFSIYVSNSDIYGCEIDGIQLDKFK